MTAVEILFNKLWELPKDKLTWHAVLKETKDIEKQQIVSSYCAGEKSAIDKMVMDEWSESDVHDENAEQYYNKNYKNNNL